MSKKKKRRTNKLALGTTALAVLASTIPTQVAPVHAENLKEVVYTSFNSSGSNEAATGNGTESSPYNLFQQAIENVADGGTIIISGEAFLNDITENGLPFYINKNVTIKSADGQHASLEVRAPGIILGADVKFENISLEFANNYHDAIFANGHRLDLINVTKPIGTREIDLFAGGLYNTKGAVYPSGDQAIINVEANDGLIGNPQDSKFGNIYAGSMNGDFNGTADITVSRKDNFDRLTVGTIYGSGALETFIDPNNWFDTKEPEPPKADPSQFKMQGNVNVTLNEYQVPVDGNTGTEAKTKVSTNSINGNSIALKSVDTLDITEGKINVTSFKDESLNHIPNINLGQDTVLGLTGVNRNFTVDNYSGNGTVVVGTTGKLNITNPVAEGSSINLGIQEYYDGESGVAYLDEGELVHITSPEGTKVTFTPHNTQSYLTLNPVEKDGRLEWTMMDKKKVPATPVQPKPEVPTEPAPPTEGEEVQSGLPVLTGFSIDTSAKSITKKVDEFGNGYVDITFPFSVTSEENLTNYATFFLEEYEGLKVAVGGQEAVYVDDSQEVPHYYVEKHNMRIFLQPSENDTSKHVMIVEFDGVPEEDVYNISLSLGNANLETTLTIEGSEVKPAPDTEEEGEGETVTPIINAFNIGAANKNIVKSVDDFEGTNPSIQYPFSVDADEGFSLTEAKDLEVFVGDYEAVRNGNTFRVEEHKMTITLEPTGDTYTMSVNFDNVPTEGTYNIELSVGDKSLETSLTVNAKEGNKVTAFKDYDDIKTVPFAYAGTIKLPFNVETSLDGELEFPNAETTLLVNSQPAQFNPANKTFTLDGMTFSVNHKEDKSYELVVTSPEVKAGRYDIILAQGEVVMNTALTIQAKPENEFRVLHLDELKSPGGYRPHMSYCYHWQGVLVNQNHEGKFISLKVKGDVREYPKGYTVQGDAALAFDTRFQDKYFTRLVGKVGIDSSQANVGNGATVKILTSTNGSQWTLLKTLGTVKGENDAIEFDLSMPNGAILKFEVDDMGDASGDVVSFADLKLVGDDYVEVEKVINVKGLKRVEEYDAILREHDAEYNLANHKMEILQREFVNKMGYVNIKTIYDESPEYAEAIEYLMNDPVALEYLITGGPATKDGSYNRAIRYFCDIYAKHKADFADKSNNHFKLRLAISTALVYAHPSLSTSWYGRSYNTGPVTRYELYKEIVAGKYMDLGGATDGFGKWSTQQFIDLPIPLMRWVVGNRMNNDEVKWLADYALSQKEAKRNYLDAYNYIEYLDGNFGNPKMYDLKNKDKYNAEYGNFSNYYDNYGESGLVRLWMVFEEGAVCGGLSKTYHNLATTFGRPSSVLGQPGHGAAMTWGWNSTLQRYEWQIQNDIYGWANSGNEIGDRLLNWGNKPWTVPYAASYNILATDAVLDKDNKFNTATLLNFLANSYSEGDREEVFEQALEVQPINLESMEGLINAYKADPKKTSQDYLNLAKRIVSTYTYYPQVMVEMLALIKDNITDDGHTVEVDILKNNALNKAYVATAEQSTNPHATKQLAEKYLKGEDFGEVATFSFDGANAGKIVMNERYSGAQIMLEYSLDGGNKWTQTSNKVITLSKKELESITADNDIKIRLVGVDTIHTIDIVTGPATTGNKVIANDYENLLVGNLTNLEFSYDGEEWCDYVTGQEQTINPNGLTGIRFNGEKQVHVRYKASGTTLAGESQVFNFTPNEDTPEKSYVQLREVKVISAPQHQKGREPQNAINGSIVDNGYHTTFGTTTKDKVMTFEFSTPKYITSMDYMFGGGNNGRMKNGTIQASMDGKEWKVIKTFKDMPRDKSLQEYKMDEVVEAKFIKIVADETHGNSGQHNMFLAMLDLRFYEDTTKLPVKDVVPEEPTPPAQEPAPEGPSADDVAPPPVQEDSSEGTPPSDNVGTTDKLVDVPPSNSVGTGTNSKTEDTPVTKPTTGDAPANKPVEDTTVNKPVENKPSTEGIINKPVEDTPVNKPVENKPSTEGSTNKPSTEGTINKPTTEGTNKPSTEGSTDKPSTDTNKPVEDKLSTNTGTSIDTSKSEDKPSNNGGTTTDTNKPSTDVSTGGSMSSTPSTDTAGSDVVTPPSTNINTTITAPSIGKQPAGSVTLNKEEPQVTTPSNDTNKVEAKPSHTNKVEKIEELSKGLVEKVDSIIADVVKSASNLVVSIVGDKEDVKHVSSLEVTKEGIFADVEGEKVKFDTNLDLENIDWSKYRVVRKDSTGEGFSAVPHKSTGEGFKISSSNLEGIVITEKVNIPFKDVTDKDWFKGDVEEMYNYGFTTGTTAETFSPYDNITRGQFAAMIARALELTPNSEENTLTDTKDKWYANDAQALFDAGIIKGFSDGTFGGDQKLTRQQAATMISNMLKYAGVDTEVKDDINFKDITKVSEGAQDAVKFLASKGVLVSGEEVNFNPQNNITRSQMSKLLVRSLHLTDLY